MNFAAQEVGLGMGLKTVVPLAVIHKQLYLYQMDKHLMQNVRKMISTNNMYVHLFQPTHLQNSTKKLIMTQDLRRW